jgi:hypothetical protein
MSRSRDEENHVINCGSYAQEILAEKQNKTRIGKRR